MKSNKGFTLVELLAVIAILAILVLIALPNTIEMFKEAKKNSFLTECKQIYKTAQNQWMSDSMFETNDQLYSRCNDCTGKKLKLSGREEIDYYIKLNKAGKITDFYITDNTFQYKYNGANLLITDITEAEEIASVGNEDIIKIENNNVFKGTTLLTKEKNRKFDIIYQATPGTLTLGDEVAIDTEHFIVLESDSSKTTVIAKYNLNVGNFLVTSAQEGLQSSGANGYINNFNKYGCVAFSGSKYWEGKTGNNKKYPGKLGTSPYAFVYDNDYKDASGSNYSVAYYVNQYIDYLSGFVSFNMVGRIPQITDLDKGRTLRSYDNVLVFQKQCFLMGSAWSSSYIIAYTPSDYFDNNNTPTAYNDNTTGGVKVVLEVATSSIL